MANGPVVRRKYDLIMEPPVPGAEKIWHAYVSPPKNYVIRLLKGPGDSELSTAESKMIAAIFKKFGAKHWTELINVSHKFAEWRDPEKRKVTQIDVKDILKAGNKTDSEIEEIVSELESLAVVERMISW